MIFELLLLTGALLQAADPLDYRIELVPLHKQTDPKWQWFGPRPTVIPWKGKPLAMITLQKHLFVSDYYAGPAMMLSRDLGKSWSAPLEVPELSWRSEPGGVTVAVADVTPGWHRKSKRVLAIGARVRYDAKGHQLDDKPKSHQTSWAVFDPKTEKWTEWKMLAMPDEPRFNYARSASAQWIEREDGTVLLPFYHSKDAKGPHAVTVAEFRFDGRELTYLRHGSEHELNVVRGLVEPSMVRFNGLYFLTVRNDLKGYVSTSKDGLHYEPLREWLFDDGGELGSYNTQAHWLAHSDGLFLTYTRKGANNDHVMRHRAPLFIAQVDPATLRVMRKTERVLLPERGATFGNFGAAAITAGESWVTDSEGMFSEVAKNRGAEGVTWLARIRWAKPNRLVRK
jgi:hypothetical protein